MTSQPGVTSCSLEGSENIKHSMFRGKIIPDGPSEACLSLIRLPQTLTIFSPLRCVLNDELNLIIHISTKTLQDLSHARPVIQDQSNFKHFSKSSTSICWPWRRLHPIKKPRGPALIGKANQRSQQGRIHTFSGNQQLWQTLGGAACTPQDA